MDNRAKRVVMLGECMVELASLDAEKKRLQSFAGDTFNTAVYFKRSCKTNMQVQYLTAAGTDSISQQFIEFAQSEQVCTDLVFRDEDKTLGLYMISTDSTGERSFSYWRSDSAAKHIMQHWQQHQALINAAEIDLFYFSGISLAILSEQDRALLWQQLDALKAQQRQIVFDPNYRSRLWPNLSIAKRDIARALQYCDIALTSQEEQATLFADSTIEQSIKRLLDWQVSEIVIKNGEHGITLYQANADKAGFTADQITTVATQKANSVVDTTSAGDAFNGAYLAQRLQNQSMQTAAQCAAQVAACVIQHPGAIIDKNQLNQTLHNNK